MPSSKPNILFLFTDMQRADTLHALGNEVIKTPHLDRLVAEGTAYTNCFSPSPVCCPARCSTHYGLYPQRTGTYDNMPWMADNGKSYPAVLTQNGYRTHSVGKYHMSPDYHEYRGFQTRRFQEEIISDPALDDYVAWLAENGFDHFEPHGARGDMYYIPQVSSLPAKAHPTQWVGDESRKFIQDAASGKDPWFLYAGFIHPHPPFAPPKPWHKLYRTPEMPLPFVPENCEQFYTWINRLQNRYKFRDRGIDQNLMRLIKAYYYATISFVDYQVGRIMQSLEQAGQLENTLIVYSSDHGEHLGDFNCFGKRSMHDASARVPMVVRYPERFKPGQRCSKAVSLVDLAPTFLEAAGIETRDLDLDGVDLATVANGSSERETVYSQFMMKGQAIYMAVSEQRKYVYSAGDGCEFFFDRNQDPREISNLADQPAAQKEKAELKGDLLRFLKRSGEVAAYDETSAGLDWKQYPRIDETYLQDPDARLVFQDDVNPPHNATGIRLVRPSTKDSIIPSVYDYDGTID